jgi:hypothetical protein
MENSSSDANSSKDSPDEELLSLAFDCTEMVNELGQGFELEKRGEHESAMETLEAVEKSIDGWLSNLKKLEAEGIDEKELIRELGEAREAISFDSRD